MRHIKLFLWVLPSLLLSNTLGISYQKSTVLFCYGKLNVELIKGYNFVILESKHYNASEINKIKKQNKKVLAYIKVHIPEEGKGQLAGSSIYVDRGFLAKYMPEIDQYLHYRLIDVSSIKELTRRWYPKVYFNTPEKTGNHRALADIRESIAELRYYRDAVFVDLPGPDGEAAKTMGASHVVDHS